MPIAVRRVHDLPPPLLASLARLTMDCVDGGASIGFMWPLPEATARAFWQRVAAGMQSGERALLVAESAAETGGDGAARLLGTVQLLLAQPDNQPHRADLAKLQVHRHARRQGVAEALMRAAESTARAEGKTLLVLDTVSGSDADRLYTRLHWQRVGEVPGFALWPRGGLCPTTFFYKSLGSALPQAQRSAN
jgi:GNAT superfamily N-acetyltransferase